MKPILPLSNQSTGHSAEIPAWVAARRGETAEMAAFSSGAALAVLHPFVAQRHASVPGALLRQRLALQATEYCLTLEGRRDSPGDIRDAVCLHRAGEALGPAGEVFSLWSQATRLPMTHRNWLNLLTDLLPATLGPDVPALVAEAGHGDPVGGATSVLVQMLTRWPRAETAALICADVVLARALGWFQPVPLLGWTLPRKLVRQAADGEKNMTGCHQALTQAATQAIRIVRDLERRAEQLRAAAPKLRAKASDAAVELFLTQDAVFPGTMLTPIVRGTSQPMTDRAARRLCDRLVSLGVIRELTGRPSFRIYGV
ncbi:DUF1403 family protein (plasmid) [Aliisedimentitalea scapharcae]|uniref:DUF1403 family protein n=1 Tax=Aliisedimentitalea scapharcae TaxID=1524259 RepID=A0ABZ2Y0C9_9RHOB